MRVTAAVVDKPGGRFHVEELDLDEPGPGEALGGSGRSQPLIGTLIELHRQGRFPFDRLVRFYDLAELETALEDSHRGEVLKPVLRMKEHS